MNEESSSERCEYTWPEDHDEGDDPDHQSCCWREAVNIDGEERCIWHADPEAVDKSVEALQKARAPPTVRDQNSPFDELLDGAKIEGVPLQDAIAFENLALRGAVLRDVDVSWADLRDTDLSRAHLRDINLSGALLQDADLSGADLCDVETSRTEVYLQDANLSGATLRGVDFSEAFLQDANLSRGKLRDVNLSEVDLRNANLSGADFRDVNLSEADLQNADLSGAEFKIAHLQNAHLGGCELTGARIWNANIDEVAVDGRTTCEILNEGYGKQRPVHISVFRQIIRTRPRWWPGVGESDFDAKKWDSTAQAYHGLKEAFNNYGLVSKARQQHLRERGARRCEARAAAADNGTVKNWLRWFRSVLVWQLTGYGVSVRRILRNMGIVFGSATFAYLLIELQFSGHAITEDYSTVPELLYYSIITFTTTPPVMPPSDPIKAIVMAEAFVGTLLLIFLGYVLGTREQF